MILTQMHLNSRRAGARKLLGSPQAMHAAVLSGFPAGLDAQRPLWRVDLDDPLRPTLYVLSKSRPDLTHIVEQGGWPSLPDVLSASYAPILDSLEEGQSWAFRLTSNPTHRGTVNGQKKILGHVTVAQQMGWLLGKAESLGMGLGDEDEPTFQLTSRAARQFRRGGDLVTINTATFNGVLEVKDPELFKQALVGGIGRAKAYGCGLLTLAPPR